MRTLLSIACAATLFLGISNAQDLVVRAGTIHPCGGGEVLTNGAAIWIQDGKIKAIGKDVPAPVGTPEVDYGMGAVIAPGLVATKSGYGSGVDSDRTAAPFVRAIDNFNAYAKYHSALRAGVTTAFLEPGQGDRLISGQGAVIKMAGEDHEARVLSASNGVIGSVASNARFAPGFWEPRLPATVDVGLGFENRQFPRTVMGAVVALRELISFARGDGDFASEYGTPAGEALGDLIRKKAPWRLRAETDEEVAALIELFANSDMTVVIEGLEMAPDSAGLLAKAGHRVIYQVSEPNLANFGKDPDQERPSQNVAASLKKNGVPFAIQGWDPTSLRFAAGMAMRGGLDAKSALEAITFRAAEAMGVADRVGSLQVGRDGDLVIYNGNPMDSGSSVLATMIDGSVVYDAKEVARKLFEAKNKKAGKQTMGAFAATMPPVPTVISVEELHVGNGEILRPGEVLMQGGKIVEVGARVSRPGGANVVQGFAAMPGAIDVLGHLGMEGANPRLSKTFEMPRMLEPGDRVDRHVALAGTTTVNMTSPSRPNQTTTMLYKPADADIDRMVVRGRASILLSWPSGSTAALLKRSKEYNDSWIKYEKGMEEWRKNPPAPEADKKKESDDEESEEDEEESEEKKDSKKKKKKKKNKEKPKAIAVTGTFEAQLTLGDQEEQKVRLRLLEGEAGELEGTLRVADYPLLIFVTGKRTDYSIRLDAQTVEGGIALALELGFEENDAEKPFLEGRRLFRGVEDSLKLPRTGTDYPEAKRPTPSTEEEKEDKPKTPKGMPKKPSPDPLLDLLRAAGHGKASVFVTTNRDDIILSCVAAFEALGIKPVLVGATAAQSVADQIVGRVSGVVLFGNPVFGGNRGLIQVNRMAQLQAAGIPVAFASRAEEGAAGLIDFATLVASEGWSAEGALRALTSDAAHMLAASDLVGSLQVGCGGDLLLLDGSPLKPSTRILNVWVNGVEVQR